MLEHGEPSWRTPLLVVVVVVPVLLVAAMGFAISTWCVGTGPHAAR